MLPDYYLWLKAMHIIAVISWMAALLYLPRLFVYHVDAEIGSIQSETFKVMERRLIRIIGNVAMVFTWVFGGLLVWANPDVFSGGWMHAKFTCVCLMTVLHHMFIRWYKDFNADNNTKSAKYFRIANEIPTFLMIIIVILVVVKPF